MKLLGRALSRFISRPAISTRGVIKKKKDPSFKLMQVRPCGLLHVFAKRRSHEA